MRIDCRILAIAMFLPQSITESVNVGFEDEQNQRFLPKLFY